MNDPSSNKTNTKRFECIIALITINLGINPVNGGIPAKDNIMIITMTGIIKWILWSL